MKNKKTHLEKPYHELPDCSVKLLRICVQAKLLPQSAHQVYLAITDRFNSSGELVRECFEGAAGISRRTGICKKQTTDVANRLCELGFLKLRYRVWFTDSKKDFDNFEDAVNFQKEQSQNSYWGKWPTLVRVYSEPESLPSPEDLGLALKNKKDHIYWAPEHLKWTAIKKPQTMEENNNTLVSTKSPPPSNILRTNDTNLNGTKTNVTKETVNINNLNGEDLRSLPIPIEVSDLITAFKAKYFDAFGSQIPDQLIKSFMDDKEALDTVLANILTVINLEGTIDGWINCEFERMKANVSTGKYRTPKLEYFKNTNSLNAYIDLINGEKLKKDGNPFSDYLCTEEFKLCLTKSPEDDHLLIRNQVILNSYSEHDISGMKELINGLTNYADFFEIRPSTFVYVTLKHLAFGRPRPPSLLKLAKKFSDETNNSSLLGVLLQPNNLELIEKAKNLM